MTYLSKGTLRGKTVDYRGKKYALTPAEKAAWVEGTWHFAETAHPESPEFSALREYGLIECEDVNGPVERYRILSRSILLYHQNGRCPHSSVRKLLCWIRYAGLRLSTAELVYLTEKQIEPTPDLLGERNRQKLVEVIYTPDTIFDNILESQMEASPARDEVVDALELLLYLGKITLY